MAQKWAVLAGVVAGFWIALAHGEDFEVTLSYGVFAKGFKGLSVDVEVEVEGTGYSARLDARTAGVVSWFFDWQMQAESAGALDGGAVAPAVYKAQNARGESRRWLEIDYVDDGSAKVLGEPSAADDGRPEVGPEMTVGTIDPLSALVGALLATTDGQICPERVAIFDGRRRYDMESETMPVRRFTGSGLAPYAGEAAGCRVVVEQIAGFKEKETSNRDVLNSEIAVWLADVADNGFLLPVRLEMRGRAGRMLIHLQQVRDRMGAVVFGES